MAHEEAFQHKYRCFYAVSKTIAPRSIIELGTCAGASADAYLSAAPDATFIGLDVFGINFRKTTAWNGILTRSAEELLYARGFKDWKLVRGDLRLLKELPGLAELVVVDAAHDFENEYADLQLALTPTRVSISFTTLTTKVDLEKPAIAKFPV